MYFYRVYVDRFVSWCFCALSGRLLGYTRVIVKNTMERPTNEGKVRQRPEKSPQRVIRNLLEKSQERL
jgi:hypothetical protein